MTQRPLPRLTKGASSVSPTGARAASPPRAAVSRHGEATPGARASRHGDGGARPPNTRREHLHRHLHRTAPPAPLSRRLRRVVTRDDGGEMNLSQDAKAAAMRVLLHNIHGPFGELPRAAAWGYPEPYTRDLTISALGMLVTGEEELRKAVRSTLVALACAQTERGHIPSLAHDPKDCGASDTTPLFLIAVALYREAAGEPDFLCEATRKAIFWMEFQSPDDAVMVTQQPTSDWRDEMWVWGYGLYVNSLLFESLRLHGQKERATALGALMNRRGPRETIGVERIHEGMRSPNLPHYSLCMYKMYRSERFDLLGNSLAVLFGIADRKQANDMIDWIEERCAELRDAGALQGGLPPCLFPFVEPGDADWMPRYEEFNRVGTYHNGGVWPFVCGFYVAALVAAGRTELARVRFAELTDMVRRSRNEQLSFGFNEWHTPQDGRPHGEDWQTWSAAMYLYAASCIETGQTPFFHRDDEPTIPVRDAR